MSNSPDSSIRILRLGDSGSSRSRAAHPAWGRWKWEATHDPLTDLANRRLLEDRLARELTRWRRSRAPLTVLFIDLDRFGAINGRLGHQVGDAVLVHTAERLQQVVRNGDTVARLGGDEFVVLIPDLAPAMAVATAERARSAIAQPILLEDPHGSVIEVRVTASIGVAVAADDDGPALLHRSDLAMYEAKRTGGDRCRLLHALPARPPCVSGGEGGRSIASRGG